MEYKKEVLQHLEDVLQESTKLAFLSEVEHRTFQSMSISGGKGNQTQLDSALSQSKIQQNVLTCKVRALREVIKELKDGKLDI